MNIDPNISWIPDSWFNSAFPKMIFENMPKLATLCESLDDPNCKYREAIKKKKIYYKFGLEGIMRGGKIGPIELRMKYNMMDDYEGNQIE